MLLAQAVVNGKIALDDDVRRYLPPSFANLTSDGQPIRIVDLASHTAGLPRNLPAFPTGLTCASGSVPTTIHQFVMTAYRSDAASKPTQFCWH